MIMDGNGRWAKKRGRVRLHGHRAGAETVRRVVGYCRKYGIKYLTLYAFSTENWNRPHWEVAGLMKLLDGFLKTAEDELTREKVRLRVIGRRDDIPDDLRRTIEHVEEISKDYEHQLIIALSYGGRAEIADAAKRLAADVKAGVVDPESVDEKTFSSYLYAPDVPDPDLVVRTSGEIRISNFLTWESAYSEFFFTPTLWPDFSEKDFVEALESYSQRNRRFGGTETAKAAP